MSKRFIDIQSLFKSNVATVDKLQKAPELLSSREINFCFVTPGETCLEYSQLLNTLCTGFDLNNHTVSFSIDKEQKLFHALSSCLDQGEFHNEISMYVYFPGIRSYVHIEGFYLLPDLVELTPYSMKESASTMEVTFKFCYKYVHLELSFPENEEL